MGEVAVVAPRRRKVRCPNCHRGLSEPGSPIYECPFCFTLLLAKGIPPDFRGESWQMPVNENNQGVQNSQQRNEPIDGSEQIRSQRQDQLNNHKTNEYVSVDGNTRHQEKSLSEIVPELQLENDVGNGSTSVGDIDMSADYASTAIGEQGMAVDCGEKEGALESSGCESQLLLDHAISSQLPLEDAKNCSVQTASEEEKEFVGECEGVEEKNHKECDPAGEGNEQTFQSEIIRDTEYELSFKYISSAALETNDQLAHKKRTPRLSKLSSEKFVGLSEVTSKPLNAHITERRPFSSDENSDDYESYSSASASASHGSLDSEFDFPSPSAEITQKPPNVSDLLFEQKMSLFGVCCDAPETPHQLQWQDVDHVGEEIALPNSNGATASTVEVDAKTASDVLNGVEQGDQVERAEVECHLQKEDPIKKETCSVGIQETAAIVRESLHIQRENAELIGGLDLLPSGAEHSLNLKSGSTLKEGLTDASMLILATEPPMCSESDGSKLEICLVTQENIELINSVANLKLEGSITTVASESAVITGRASNKSKLASPMIFIEKTQEMSSDPSPSQQNMLLPDANNQSRKASTNNDVSTRGDVDNVHVVQNEGPESVEQGDSSGHNAVNNSESRLHHKRNSSEATRRHVKVGTGNMFESRLHKRNHSQEETQVRSDMSRSTRISDGSSKTHQRRHPQAAFGLAAGQGPCLQNHQSDLYMEHIMNYAGSTTDVQSFSPPSSQPFGSTCHSNGSDSFARGVSNASSAFSYQAPSHPWMLPVMPPQAFLHYGCHSVAPVCMACIHCQHSHLPQLPLPPCGLCFNQPVSLAHQQGRSEFCNCHWAPQIQASDQRTSVLRSPTCFSSPPGPIHDTAMAREKPLVSSARKPKHYPPLPRGSTAPYIICERCDEILEVPTDILVSDTAVQKLRCGECYKVAKFSVFKDNQGTSNVALDSTSEASTSSSHAIQYTKHSRQPPVSNVVQSMDCSYHQGIISGLHPPIKQGSFDSQQQISAAIKRSCPSSLDEMVQSTQCEADTPDQDEFFFRSLSRHSDFESSRIFFNGFKASSSAIGASNIDGLVVGNDVPLQVPVDEKEEGLDFGAPRMSDGESLGQKSPESRMRSPENKQDFQLLDQKRHTKDFLEAGDACWTSESMEQQAFDLKKKLIAQGKKPSTSLFALLSRESSKFEINMEERDSFDEFRSVLWSNASSSPMDDDHTNERSNGGDSSLLQACKSTSNHFVRKGQRYVAGMLRRSLKDFHRGSQ